MKFNVIWTSNAIEALQRIYDTSDDQEGLVHTVTRIEIELESNAIQAGESRDRGRRILIKYPLVVWYEINERTKDVSILKVHPMRR